MNQASRSGKDVLDAQPTGVSSAVQPSSNRRQVNNSTVLVDSGTFDREKYRMDYANRGHAVIINNRRFYPHLRLADREGSDVDASAMYQRFQELGFETDLLNDATSDEIIEKLKECAEDDSFNQNSDCFACCILTHGNEHDTLYAVDKEMSLKDFTLPFQASKCKSLIQKPKLFIVQACRGKTMSGGQDVQDMNESDAVGDYSEYNQYLLGQSQAFRVPDEADFLFMFSTFDGKQSIRNTERGSPFITFLSEEVSKLRGQEDIYRVLTRVNRSFLKHRSTSQQLANKYQMPCFQSTLTKGLDLGCKE